MSHINPHRLRPTLLAAALLATSFGALAQTATTETVLPEILVSADPIDNAAQKAHDSRRASPNAITVIEASQLNQFGDQPLGDALRRLVGISFPGANRAREIQLRNVGTEYTQVTVNGRRLLDANSKRTVQVDRIPSSMVERIEIIRTPLASQDAQGAAGTVNVVLKQGLAEPVREFGIGLGNLSSNGGLGDATLLYSTGDGPVRFSINAGIQQQRRNESNDTLAFNGAGVANGGTLVGNERRFEQGNVVPRLDLKLGGRNDLFVEVSFLRTTEYRDNIERVLTANQLSVNTTEVEKRIRERENTGLLAAWTHRFSPAGDIVAAIDWQKAGEDTRRDATRFNAAGVVNRTRQRTEDITLELIKPSLKTHWKLGGHALEFGASHAGETRDETNGAVQNGVLQAPDRGRIYTITERITSLYAQDTFSPFGRGRLTAGLRTEHSSTRAKDFFGAEQSRSQSAVLPSVSYVLPLAGNVDLRAGAARTLRRPDLRELSPTVVVNAGTIATPDTGGNPDTVPETVTGFDAGLDWFGMNRRALASVNLFARDFENKIERIAALEAARFVSRPQNVGDGRMHGVELEGRVPLDALGARTVTLWGNATLVRTRLTSAQTGGTRRFQNQPDEVLNLGVDWFVPSLRTTFGANVNRSSGYFQRFRRADGTEQSNDVAHLDRLDLAARVELGKQSTLSFAALNVLAPRERRVDTTYNAAGAVTAFSRTKEPTYGTVYVRLETRL